MKRFNLSAWAVSHPTLVLFLMLVLGVAGFFSYQKLGRAEDPFFTVKVVNVSVLWPGATAQEMQAQVADPIEKKIQELPYFEKVQTYSKPGFTALQVTFRDSTPPKDVPYLFYLLRKKLVDVQGQLPSGILGPVVNDEFSDVDSILYMMTGDGADYAQLKKVSEGFRQRLLKVPGVTKVDVYGNQDERIFVEFSHAKLATLGITPQALFDSLAKQNNVTPAGTVETSSQRVPLRVTGALDGVKAVAETPVESNGRVFRLGDIATITHGYVDPPSFKVRQEGKAAIGIGVVTAKGANILDLGKEVEKATAEFMKAVPQGVDVRLIADQPKVVEHAVSEFVHSFMEALVIVLFVSFLALGWRTGIVVALSVPLVLGIVFIVMNSLSLDLHRITLGALIIALGLLVDDAIIAVEMMVVKMEQGWDRMRAASFAWESTAFPMLTGTLVTAAGFLPIGFANSAVGEYAGSIFWIVAIALVASWFVAVIFTPYIGVMLLPNIKVHQNHDPHAVYETRMYRGLRAVVQWCVNHRITVVAATVGVFVASIVGFGHVQQQFFPLSERPELFLQLRLPEGTAFNVTEKAVKEAETLLKDDKDIDTYTAYVGQGSPRFWLGLNPQLPNEAFAEIVIVAKGVEARERVKAKIERAAADGMLTEARVRVDRFNFGPPVGFPVQFRVIGPDANKVREIAYQVRDIMRDNKNVKDVQLDWNEQSPYLKLVVDQDRARAMGLTPQDVSQALSMLISGSQVTTIRDGIEKVGVVARAVPSERLDLGGVGDLTITSRDGVAVPLQQIAKNRICPRGADPVAAQPGHGDHRALRRRRRRAGARRHRPDRAEAEGHPGQARSGLPDRAGRGVRGVRQGQCLDLCPLPADGHGDVDAADGSASKLLPPDPGVPDRAARHRRRLPRAQHRQCPVRLRGAARPDRARRYDHAQRGHPGRPDRDRRFARADPARSDRRGNRPPCAPRGAHGARRHPGHGPAVALGLLGPDGDHHHGRIVRRDVPDAALPAGPLRPVVPQEPG